MVSRESASVQVVGSSPRRRRSRGAGNQLRSAGLADANGLHLVAANALTIRRQRRGKGFTYLAQDGTAIRNAEVLRRLKALAVPPAYADVRYAEDPKAHLQAVGRDAAGRLQYRYHPDWQVVREQRKARRLARLAEALPKIRRSTGQYLGGEAGQREFAFAGVIELVACSAVRPGSESYTRLHRTRGATTLLKSNVTCAGDVVTLTFRSKGGRQVQKVVEAPRLASAVRALRKLPGRRLFRFRTEAGEMRDVTAREVNAFLREIAGVRISLKDFRTLLASVGVLDALSRTAPASGKRGQRRQVLEAIRFAAAELDNTPAVCAKSYVHESVVNAFEEGALQAFSDELRPSRSSRKREQVLARIVRNL